MSRLNGEPVYWCTGLLVSRLNGEPVCWCTGLMVGRLIGETFHWLVSQFVSEPTTKSCKNLMTRSFAVNITLSFSFLPERGIRKDMWSKKVPLPEGTLLHIARGLTTAQW